MDLKYLYLATVIILLVEVAAGRYRGLLTKTNVLSTLGCIIGNSVSRPIATALIAFVIGALLPAYKGALAGTPLMTGYLAVFIITEFCFYWVHRWSHESKGKSTDWLWKLHRTHHSGKFINVTVTVRQNVMWAFVVPTPWVLGVAVYLGLPEAAALTLTTIYGWNLITHADFRWDDQLRKNRHFGRVFRALEHVFVSPGIHHTHHGYGNDGKAYRNFAVTLSVIDWMFGTLHIPDGRPWKYGTPGPQPHWAEDVFYPFVRSRKVPQATTAVTVTDA